jgi:hypothetical protein
MTDKKDNKTRSPYRSFTPADSDDQSPAQILDEMTEQRPTKTDSAKRSLATSGAGPQLEEAPVYRSLAAPFAGNQFKQRKTDTPMKTRGILLASDDVFRSAGDGDTVMAVSEVVKMAGSEPAKLLGLPKSTLEFPSSREQVRSSDYPPPVPAGYLEPCYHLTFPLTTKGKEVLDAVAALFRSFGENIIIETERATPFRLRCSAYPVDAPSMSYVVRVYLYSPPGGQCQAIEFQRRNGDLVLFSDIWDRTRRHLINTKIISNVALPPPRPTLPKLPSVTISEEQIKRSLECLLQMAASDFEDVKVQAVTALCRMSVDHVNRKCMRGSQDCLRILLNSLGFADDADRCAFYALLNLVGQGDHDAVAARKSVVTLKGLQRACDLLTKTKCKQVANQGVNFLCAFRSDDVVRLTDCVEQLQRCHEHLQSVADESALKLAAAYDL